MTRDQWAEDQASILSRVNQQKSALSQAEEALRQQRQELDDLVSNLQRAPAAAGHEVEEELQLLRLENAELRQLLEQSTAPSGSDDFSLQLRRENEELRQKLANVENRLARSADGSGADAAKEIASLRKQLSDKDAQLRHLQDQNAGGSDRDVESYETELNEYRKQLETDRNKLNREIEQMRAQQGTG